MNEAREIIPACGSLDTIFLTDKTPNAINQITTERLARKIMGIKAGCQAVEKESDWKKPGNAKSWKTKVDRQMWERIDPMLNDKDHIFVNRKAEDELRTEMDREARMLKARSKLDNVTK